jgi:hypothetical protein
MGLVHILSVTQDAAKLADGIAGYGAVGICLVALSIWYILKDKKYEKRIDERLLREAQFQSEYAQILEKYRTAMEKVSSALDVTISLLKNGRGGTP